MFGLFNIEEKELTEETAILTAVSDKNGIFIFEDVPFGNYLVKEIKPADGFMPNEMSYPVTISENEEVVEITAVNDRYPEIRTTATIEGRKEVGATDIFTLEDEVEYKHLIFGKEYTIKGILMDKSTGEPFTEDGREITAEITFTAEESNGFITVPFTFDASKIKQDTDIVVFESLYSDGLELAVHADIEDTEQTVTVKIPEIHTTANINGKKDVTAEKTITVTDIVKYENLTVGKEYTVKGILTVLRGEIAVVVAVVVDGELVHDLESCIYLSDSSCLGISLSPGLVSSAHTEHIGAVAAHGVPPGQSKLQLLTHGLAAYYLIGIVVFERQRIRGLGSLVGDLGDIGKEFSHSKNLR